MGTRGRREGPGSHLMQQLAVDFRPVRQVRPCLEGGEWARGQGQENEEVSLGGSLRQWGRCGQGHRGKS